MWRRWRSVSGVGVGRVGRSGVTGGGLCVGVVGEGARGDRGSKVGRGGGREVGCVEGGEVCGVVLNGLGGRDSGGWGKSGFIGEGSVWVWVAWLETEGLRCGGAAWSDVGDSVRGAAGVGGRGVWCVVGSARWIGGVGVGAVGKSSEEVVFNGYCSVGLRAGRGWARSVRGGRDLCVRGGLAWVSGCVAGFSSGGVMGCGRGGGVFVGGVVLVNSGFVVGLGVLQGERGVLLGSAWEWFRCRLSDICGLSGLDGVAVGSGVTVSRGGGEVMGNLAEAVGRVWWKKKIGWAGGELMEQERVHLNE
ncbi:hypothetical protein Tco_0855481 [Tanacetum coccineum]